MGLLDGVAGKLSGLFGGGKKKRDNVPKVGRVQRAPADDPSALDGSDYNDYDDSIGKLFDDDDSDDGDAEVEVSDSSDILSLLRIQPNIPIPLDVLMPDNLMDLSFTITEPRGYSAKQVDEFVNAVGSSLKWYIQTMQERNKNIADLANQITKTEQSMTRLKMDQELSSDGISVSSGDVRDDTQLMQLQFQLMQARDENEKLRKQVKNGGGGAPLSDGERESLEAKYSELQDQLAIIQRKYQNLQESNRRLKLQLAGQMDAADDTSEIGALELALPDGGVDAADDAGALPFGDADSGFPSPDSTGGDSSGDDDSGLEMPLPAFDGSAASGLPVPSMGETAREASVDPATRSRKRIRRNGDASGSVERRRRNTRRGSEGSQLSEGDRVLEDSPHLPSLQEASDADTAFHIPGLSEGNDTDPSIQFTGDDDDYDFDDVDVSMPDSLVTDDDYDDISEAFSDDNDISFDFTD